MTQPQVTGDVGPVGHQGARVGVSQRKALAVNGWIGVLIGAASIYGIVEAVLNSSKLIWIPIVVLVLICTMLVVVPPGRTSVIQFFGSYIGTVLRPGFWIVVPLTTKRTVSVRVRNFETSRLKVNDADGNPIEIAAIVVWQVRDTAKSTYAVDNYLDFVSVQSESALRHVANSYPYDIPGSSVKEVQSGSESTGTSLRGSTDEVAGELAREVAERVSVAGVEILEVRISHLAYAQEIAQAMLRRQQASAVVAARGRIVEGAVGMVELALARLTEDGVVDLDEERKASMVSNLMVVLCGDQPPSPIVNTGSLYT
ncbi:SPFH domain-containing protein [Microlunatus elymi]|uniref:SPFH domain-containing protein n=1 Tax=Microlunatus elymi TaxID=2596828 RepID=A0A516PTP3_9ACTN|nr:SPFH domain-containing protein [Microlunatus elymi]QDP94565.1 SPFH domain-containing protein [Microlunatus elymi]